MGIQQSVNATVAGVLGAAVVGKHLKQQQEVVKSTELRELAGIDKEIANKTDVRDKAVEDLNVAKKESQNYETKAEKDKAYIEKKLKDKRLNPAGEKYTSYTSALDKIEEGNAALKDAMLAAEKRIVSAQEYIKLYQKRKAELEKKYGNRVYFSTVGLDR